MKSRRLLPPLSEAQREIMQIVWTRGEVTVAQVLRVLAARRPVARNTVLTVMTRLADKGWLQTRQEGNAFHYTAALPREAALAGEVRRLVDTVFQGSAEGLVMSLLEGGGLSPQEGERIRQMLLKAKRQNRSEKP